MGRLILLLVFAWPFCGHANHASTGPEMVVVGSTVNPGGLARLSVQWTGLPTANVELVVEADRSLTVLHAPSTGNSAAGSTLVLLMVHPFARPGKHAISLQLILHGKMLVRGEAAVHVHTKCAVESTLTSERLGSLSVLHTNAGNAPIIVDGISLEPGESRSTSHTHQQQNAIRLRATGQGWDSSYTLMTTEHFFPSATAPKKGSGSPRLLLGSTGQWTAENLLLTSSVQWKQGSWQGTASSWNSTLRCQGSYAKDGNSWSVGHGNSSALAVLRPVFSPYARLRFQRGLYAYLNTQSALLKKRWEAGGLHLEAGGLLYKKQLQPVYAVRWGREKLNLDYRAAGTLQQLEVGMQQGVFHGYGRILAVPHAWEGEALQRSGANFGGSVQLPHVRWNVHSAYQEFSGTWAGFHTTQLQWNKGPWSVNTRGLWHENNHFFRGNLHVQYTNGSHTLGIRQQYQQRVADQLHGWGMQYRWKAGQGQWATTLNRLGDRWTWRSQGSIAIRGLLLQGQGAYSSLSKDRWFYQLSISKTFHGSTVSLGSGRRMPVRLGLKGQLFEQNPYKTLGGSIVDAHGNGLPGIVLECEGKKVQTDVEGKFKFAHLEKSKVKVAFSADKIPFSFYPKNGFIQEFTLNKSVQNVEIQLNKNCGVEGLLTAHYDGPSFLLPAPKWEELTLFIRGKGRKWQCKVEKDGKFRLSGFPPGQYTLEVGGLGRYFESDPMDISVKDGEVLNLELTVRALAQEIPVQQL